MTISEIKKSAKTKLIGSYIKTASASLLYFIILLVLTYLLSLCSSALNNNILETFIDAIFAIISSILGYGLIANIINLTNSETNAITDFINLAIKNTTKYIKTLLYLLLKILAPIMFFILSGFYLIGTRAANINQVNFLYFSKNLLPLAVIIFILSFIVLIYFILKYIIVAYVYHQNKELTPKQIVQKTSELMKGNKLKYILLILSFLSWFLLAAIIIFVLNHFIPIQYITPFVILFYSMLKPYIAISTLEFYESL